MVISPLGAYLLFTDIVFGVGGYGGCGSEVADTTSQQEAGELSQLFILDVLAQRVLYRENFVFPEA